jgi:hypothetical protein
VDAVGFSALLALHLIFRLLHAKQYYGTDLGRPLLAGSDAFYHAHRTELLFDSFPRLVFFDPKLASPHGAIAEWGLGFDYFFAALFSLLGLFGAEWRQLVWALPVAPVAISLLSLWLFFRLACAHLDRYLAFGAALCFSLNLGYISVSTLGEYDHHVNEVAGVALLLLLPGIIGARGSALKSVLSGIGLSALVWNTTLFAYLASLFFFVWQVTRMREKRPGPLPYIRPFAISLFVSLIGVTIVESIGHGAFFSFTTLSLTHMLAIIIPVAWIGSPFHIKARHLAVFVLGALALLAIFRLDAVLWVINYVTGWDSFIGNVSESKPIFMTRGGPSFIFVHIYFGVLYIAIPIVFLFLRRALHEKSGMGPSTSSVIWFSLVLYVVSFSQLRFAHLATPGFVLLVFLTVNTRRGRQRLFAAGIALILLLEPFLVFNDRIQTSPSTATQQAAAISKVLLSAGHKKNFGVMAPPNFGNAILYWTGMPIVTNTFFYKRYLKADLELRRITDDEALVAFLRQRKIRYLVAADDVRYRTMLLEMFGHAAEADRFSKYHYKPCHRVYHQFAYDRLACSGSKDGRMSPVGRFLFSRDATKLMRRVTVFALNEADDPPGRDKSALE